MSRNTMTPCSLVISKTVCSPSAWIFHPSSTFSFIILFHPVHVSIPSSSSCMHHSNPAFSIQFLISYIRQHQILHTSSSFYPSTIMHAVPESIIKFLHPYLSSYIHPPVLTSIIQFLHPSSSSYIHHPVLTSIIQLIHHRSSSCIHHPAPTPI